MDKKTERAEKRAQNKFDRTLKRYEKIVEKKDKGEKYSENRLTKLTNQFGDRALKLTAIQHPEWDEAYKRSKKYETERELTPNKLFKQKLKSTIKAAAAGVAEKVKAKKK